VLEWSSLLRGQIASSITVANAKLNFVKSRTNRTSQLDIQTEWIEVAKEIAGIPINSISLNSGEVHYYDLHTFPHVHLSMHDIALDISNLCNVENKKDLYPALVTAYAKAYDGIFRMRMNVNPSAPTPTFRMTAELQNLDLANLNDFLSGFSNLDNHHGILSMFTDVATENDIVIGSVKPMVEDVTLASVDEFQDNNYLRLTRNQLRNRIQEIPFQGSVEEFNDVWTTAAITLQKAFMQALLPTLREKSGTDEEEHRLPPPSRPKTKPAQHPKKETSARQC
jgi:hypothetical protein